MIERTRPSPDAAPTFAESRDGAAGCDFKDVIRIHDLVEHQQVPGVDVGDHLSTEGYTLAEHLSCQDRGQPAALIDPHHPVVDLTP